MTNEPRERPFILRWRSAVLNAPLTGTQKLCLLVLAEWADVDGTNCWPAMEKIADKASVNEKTVRRSMDELAPMGWFVRSHRRTQKGWKQFEYTLRLPDAADTMSCRTDDAPDNMPAASGDAPDTVSAIDPASTGHSDHLHRTLTSDAPDTVSTDLALPSQDLSQKEIPSPGEKVTKARGKKQTFQQFLDSFGEDDEKLDAAFDMSTRYAEKIGLPDDFDRLAWHVFCSRYKHDPSYKGKQYNEWPRVYRNAIEGNWLKLWWMDGEGRYQLTQAGKQADIRHETGIQHAPTRARQNLDQHPDPAVAQKLVA